MPTGDLILEYNIGKYMEMPMVTESIKLRPNTDVEKLNLLIRMIVSQYMEDI